MELPHDLIADRLVDALTLELVDVWTQAIRSLDLRSCIGSRRDEAAGVRDAAAERGRDETLNGRGPSSFALVGSGGKSAFGGKGGGRSVAAVPTSCAEESITASRSITMPCLPAA